MVIGATLGGYAPAMLLSGSLLPLALIAGYALVAETLARAIGYESSWPYLLSTRLLAWLVGPAELPIYPTADGIYLAVVTAVVRRRRLVVPAPRRSLSAPPGGAHVIVDAAGVDGSTAQTYLRGIHVA